MEIDWNSRHVRTDSEIVFKDVLNIGVTNFSDGVVYVNDIPIPKHGSIPFPGEGGVCSAKSLEFKFHQDTTNNSVVVITTIKKRKCDE